jgi:hypothetical protein
MDLTARREDIRRVKPGVNMRDFTGLQHLWINTLLLFPIILPPTLGTPAGAEILVQFLPRSIVSLVTYRDGRCFVSDALHGLAAVKSQKFPFLKWVVLGPRGGGTFDQVFKAAGVKFSNKVYRLRQVRQYIQGPNADSRLEFPAYDREDDLWYGGE